jgi:hypothetical protein
MDMRFTQQRENDRPPFRPASARPSPVVARMLEHVDGLERRLAALADRRDGGVPASDAAPQPAAPEPSSEAVVGALERHADAVREMLDGHDAVTERVLERMTRLEDMVAALTAHLEPPVAEDDAAGPEVELPVPEAAAPEPIVPSDAVADSRWREAVASVLRRPRARCAVCQRDAPLRSRQELAKAGWTITGRWGVCPACRSEAWHLSHDGGLPSRIRATNGGA